MMLNVMLSSLNVPKTMKIDIKLCQNPSTRQNTGELDQSEMNPHMMTYCSNRKSIM
jgi:hypothetical protein